MMTTECYEIFLEYKDDQTKEDQMGGTFKRMGEIRNADKALVGEPVGKSHFEYLSIDGKIILKFIVKK
jgi:hypothetical protein